MKKTNIKEKKNNQTVIKYKNEETSEIKKLLIILLGIIVVVFLLFFITSKYILKDGFQNDDKASSIEIVYNKVDVGTMFNRPYEEYLVFAFDSTSKDSNYYNALIATYSGKEKIYTLDLSIPKNKAYVKEKANTSAKSASDITFASVNLIHIKNGKITEFITNIEEIEKRLK